jgi:signal transduction histidine kinase
MATTTQFVGRPVYVLLFGLAALVCLTSLVRARRIQDGETRLGLVGLIAGAGGWSASHALLFLAPTPGLKRLTYLAGLILGFSTVFSWLYFCSAYTGRVYHRKRIPRALGLGVYLGVVAVKITNPLHHQYFTASFVTDPFPHLAIQQQLFHWVVTGLSYALAAVGLFMLFELFLEANQDTRPLGVLSSLTVLPVTLDIVGFSTPNLISIIYAPLGVAAFAVGVLYAFEERFLTVQIAGDVEEAVVFLDDDGRIRDHNAEAERLLPALSGTRGEYVESVPGLAGAVAGDGEVVETTVDGDRRYYVASTSRFALGQADIGQVVMLSDVTTLERQRRELSRHNEQLEEFAGGIRHELRNTIQVVRGHVEAAGAALEEGEVDLARDSLGTASETARGLTETVNDLATVARFGQTVGDTAPVQFRHVVETAWERWEGSTGLELELAVDGDRTVEANAERLHTLFGNAFDFAAQNGATAVTVALHEDGFSVAENGERPPDGDLERVFDYDEAVPSAEAGMALPTVRTIARTHGWTTSVDERYRDGVRVVVSGVTVERAEPTRSPDAGTDISS